MLGLIFIIYFIYSFICLFKPKLFFQKNKNRFVILICNLSILFIIAIWGTFFDGLNSSKTNTITILPAVLITIFFSLPLFFFSKSKINNNKKQDNKDTKEKIDTKNAKSTFCENFKNEDEKIVWENDKGVYINIEYNSFSENIKYNTSLKLVAITNKNGEKKLFGFSSYHNNIIRSFSLNKIVNFFDNNREVVEKKDFLNSLGIEYKGGYKKNKKENNNVVVFTGTFKMKRKEIEKEAESNSYDSTREVTSTTSYLVIGENTTNGKYTHSERKIEKALELKVKILKENEWYKLLEKNK